MTVPAIDRQPNPERTLFACTWCGVEQVLLDLDPRAVGQAAADWRAEHADCDPADLPRRCETCDAVSPVQPVDDRRVIGLQVFDTQAHLDWLDTHDCNAGKTAQQVAWGRLTASSTETLADPEEIIGVPRPSWSDPSRDVLSPRGWSHYRSTPAKMRLRRHTGGKVDGEITPAHLSISAKRFEVAAGGRGVVSMARSMTIDDDGTWRTVVVTLMADEARQCADLLLAAADLAESD